jgi:hypothetical protein
LAQSPILSKPFGALKDDESFHSELNKLFMKRRLLEDIGKNEKSEFVQGFEDLGDALSDDTDLSFVVKLFIGCAIASYIVKYAELQVDLFTTSSSLTIGFLFVLIHQNIEDHGYKPYLF